MSLHVNREQRRAAERAAATQAAPSAQPTTTEPPINFDVDAFFTESACFAADADESADLTADSPKSPSEAQLIANRLNAQNSTGPTSEVGKTIVAQNALRHGLAGEFSVLPNEDGTQFQELAARLLAEYKPTNPNEQQLVDSMAQHFWRMQRAISLQDSLLLQPEVDHKSFGLYLRYQTTHERAYYKAMRELQNLRKAAAKQQIGFDSQKRQQELNDAKIRLTNARASATEIDSLVRTTIEAPLPGHINIPFSDAKDAFTIALRELNDKAAANLEAKAA